MIQKKGHAYEKKLRISRGLLCMPQDLSAGLSADEPRLLQAVFGQGNSGNKGGQIWI